MEEINEWDSSVIVLNWDIYVTSNKSLIDIVGITVFDVQNLKVIEIYL